MLTTTLFDWGSIIWAAHRFHVSINLFLSVLLIATCGRLSWSALWTTFGRIIHCIVLYTVYVFCLHGTSAKPARGDTMHTLQQSSEIVAAAAVADSDAPEVSLFSSSSSLLLLLLLLTTAAVGTPYERRQNGWLHAETSGDYKRRCRIVTNRI